MEKSDETSWRLILPVGLGRHEFKFVVDGKWVHDPELNHDVNELGSQNNFVVIENVESGKIFSFFAIGWLLTTYIL